MKRVVTPRARQDAQDILRYYRKQTGSTQWFHTALDTGIAYILQWPDSGHRRLQIDENVRFWLVRPYSCIAFKGKLFT